MQKASKPGSGALDLGRVRPGRRQQPGPRLEGGLVEDTSALIPWLEDNHYPPGIFESQLARVENQ